MEAFKTLMAHGSATKLLTAFLVIPANNERNPYLPVLK